MKACPIVLYATHNIPPKLLTQAYHNVVSVHFQATIQYSDQSSSEDGVKINYLHRLSMDGSMSGASLQQDYGILVSEVFGFPPFTVEAAKKFKSTLKRESSLNYRLTYSDDNLQTDVKQLKDIFDEHQGDSEEAIPSLKEKLRTMNKAKLEKLYFYLAQTQPNNNKETPSHLTDR